MGGNTGRRIAGAGGGAGATTTPPTAQGNGTTYTNTSFGVNVADSAYTNARVLFTDANNYPQTTKQIDNLIRHTGLPADFGGTVNVVGNRDGSVRISVDGQGMSMVRTIAVDGTGQAYVYNQYFRIGSGSKYDGRGFEIFNNQVNYLSKNQTINGQKTSYIKVDAAGWGKNNGPSVYNGYYTWLRFGYNPSPAADRRITADYNRATGSNVKNAREMMSTKAGQDWWRDNGTGWNGTFDLRDGSDSRRVLSQYVRDRAKKNK
jgi:hypothetical protein